MKVLHIQTGISNSGNSITRLHNLMLKNGLDSWILCATSKLSDSRVIAFSKWRIKYFAALNRLAQFILNGKIRSNFSYPIFGHNLASHSLVKSADIIYLHWTQGGLLTIENIRSILKLGKPVILSCRDFWYLTGGCHHPVVCEKFTSHCNDCMYLTTNKYRDLSYLLFEKKSNLYSDFDNVFIFVASKWMLAAAGAATLTKNKPVLCIANVLDKNIFKKCEQSESRSLLRLPQNKTLILFGSVRPTSNKNKGWDYLVKSLEFLKIRSNKDFELVVFGTGQDDEIQNRLPYKIHFLGTISDEAQLATIYSSCNVYATSSLSEPFGNTVLESLSCETPVVSFEIGGAVDMVDHHMNGYLAAYKDPEDFATGIEYCLDNNLKGYLKPEVDPENSIGKHISLINSLLTKS